MIHNGKLSNPEVRIEVTNICNAKCVMCPREKMTRKPVTMKTIHFKKLIDQVVDMGAEMISPFGYGEPLIDGQLAEKISYCTSNGLKTFITTNASLLDTKASFDLLDAGLSNIRFSFHGVTPEKYRKVHNLDYDMAIRNINNFMSINKIRYESRCKVDVIAIPEEHSDIERIKTQWKSVDLLEIWNPHNWAGGRNFRKVENKKRTCGRPYRGPIQILADGSMVVCCFDFDGKMKIGNTHKAPIDEILIGKELSKIKAAHCIGDLDGLVCKTCDQLNIETESPLIYSSSGDMEINKTAGAKFRLEDET